MIVQSDTEQRIDERHPAFKEGRLIDDSAQEVAVTIRDMSAGGARIAVPDGAEFPAILHLKIEDSASPIPVRVCWKSGGQIGVQFLSPERAQELLCDAGSSHHDESLPAHVLERHPAQLSLRTAGHPEVSAFLVVEYDMRFEFDTFEPGRGQCIASVKLRNTSVFSAVHPFLCLPALGFDCRSSTGWDAREITSIRKMIRFGCTADLSLDPGETIACCEIILPFDPRNGGSVGYVQGIDRPLAQLPDIKLSCQSGAANFPAERLSLNIPASHIAGLIIDHVALDGELPRAAA